MNIATGESLTLIDEFARYIDERALDIVQPDAAQIGLTQLVDVARRAETVGILCIPHSKWSALCVAAHSQTCLTVRNSALVEYPAMASFEDGSTTAAATAFYLGQPFRMGRRNLQPAAVRPRGRRAGLPIPGGDPRRE